MHPLNVEVACFIISSCSYSGWYNVEVTEILVDCLLSHLVHIVDEPHTSSPHKMGHWLNPKYDFLQEKNMEVLLSLLNSENGNVTGLGPSIITHSCETSAK